MVDDGHGEDDFWERAEEVTQEEIISSVRPTPDSEQTRMQVVDYFRSFIADHLGCEVFLFGSLPWKTYLPDGDIDLTAFGRLNDNEYGLALSLEDVLKKEAQSSAASFEIKDVELVPAQVKLVRCLVQNFVVDISFNQLGGLCTLCFLEKVDRLIGRDSLFKRSVILIKAWCYYESRILGARHRLISTYALQILVLYIFHLFHSSLGGPLAVLYKFLDYFSQFDWGKYCISLGGPILISSLPKIVVEPPENGSGDLLLSDEFLRECLDLFSVPPRVCGTNQQTFQQMQMNIVDPLKDSNNLGSSVSKGNLCRIRLAFELGAHKLGCILSGSKESLAAEIPKFFSTTLEMRGKGQRLDVQDPAPLFDNNRTDLASPSSENCEESGAVPELESANREIDTAANIIEQVTASQQEQAEHEQTSEEDGLGQQADDDGLEELVRRWSARERNKPKFPQQHYHVTKPSKSKRG